MERVQENDSKIFIGPTETANIGAILAGALREKGVKVTVVSMGMGPFQAGMRYDKVFAPDIRSLNRLQKVFRYLYCWLYCFLNFFPRHNVFIFLFGISLLPYNLDLPILKVFRKKTVVLFVGSDIRHYVPLEAAAKRAGLKYYMSQERLRWARQAGPRSLKRKKRMIHMVEKYATHIVSGPSYSQLLTRRYYFIHLPMDIHSIRYGNSPNIRPVVVHAPSNAAFKGTKYILEAVEQLKKEAYDFDFRLFTGTSNIMVRETLSQADIAVDQLFASHAGIFALESMAAGCAVLGGNIPEFSGFPRELPVIHTDPDNIYDNLKMLLENPELRRELGEKGRKYVEKYHDHRKIADDYIRLITTGEADITYDPAQDSIVE